MRGGKVIYITIGDESKTVLEWEEITGVRAKSIYGRWIAMGSPKEPLTEAQTKKLFRKPQHVAHQARERMVTVLPDNVLMTYNQIMTLPECEISRSTVCSRAVRKGFALHREDLRAIDHNAARRVKGGDPVCMDADFLPHIVQGDLAHLSGTGKNTGAGKGEIPHEEWVGRIWGPKAINSSVYGITLAAFNR